jgi:F-type H+-transporting ATPase subunit epsilon
MSAFRLEIVTPERTVLQQEVEMVIARTIEGEIGVMTGHIPIVTVLEPGVMRINSDQGEELRVAISGGFLEMSADNKLTVLAQTAELSSEIDVDRALAALERAERRLANRDNPDLDVARAEFALRRALVRLQATGADRQREP